MYLNTVFKYNVFKYCPALPVGSVEASHQRAESSAIDLPQELSSHRQQVL